MTNTECEWPVGTRVRIIVSDDHPLMDTRWWPKDYATGTVERVFKNGTVAVAIDQLWNRSSDGLKTLHVPADSLHPLPEGA